MPLNREIVAVVMAAAKRHGMLPHGIQQTDRHELGKIILNGLEIREHISWWQIAVSEDRLQYVAFNIGQIESRLQYYSTLYLDHNLISGEEYDFLRDVRLEKVHQSEHHIESTLICKRRNIQNQLTMLNEEQVTILRH
jgi:hypothetical protein